MVESLCAMMTVVRFESSLSLSKACCTTSSLSLSSALVASSRRRMGGSLINARAMAIRCFCPPDSCVPESPTWVSYVSGKVMMKS
mmetsp:Transcript_2244/g.3098  ORF Transcript_2244/g.3098 Transcript_2244/m.3098 type:complete len:85 (-) Transcript_2244:744-998(-)